MTAAPAAAVAAFLRGVERRGAVFAELQCGDAEAGDTALAATLRVFRNLAGELPMAAWPQRFWSLLAASPPLRRNAPLAQWPAPLQALADAPPDARAALLLRLAAGLDEAQAATALGVDEGAYRQALAVACPRDADGRADAAAWRALAESIQRQLRELPPARLAQLRQAALRADAPPRAAVAPAFAAAPVRRRGWRGLWMALAVAAVCAAVAYAAWKWWPREALPAEPEAAAAPAPEPEGVFALADSPMVVVEELPPAPATRTQPLAAPAIEPVPPDPSGEALLRQADFLAWFAATVEPVDESGPAQQAPSAPDAESAPASSSAADDADLGARRAAWDALAEDERRQLGEASLRYSALPAQRRGELRARFDALDAMERRGWRLGPVLGAQYPRLHPLLAFVPADEAAALRSALASMDAAQREELATLLRRTPPQEVERLRRELLSTPPPRRAAWLQGRLGQ